MALGQTLGLLFSYHTRLVERVKFQLAFKILLSTQLHNHRHQLYQLGPVSRFHFVPTRRVEVRAKPLPPKMSRVDYRASVNTTKIASLVENHIEKSELPDEEWSKLKSTSAEMRINPAAFDALLMKHFSNKRYYQLGRSFLRFIEKSGRPNLLTLSHYIALCGNCIDQSSEEEIVSTLNQIPTDAFTQPDVLNSVVAGLVKTSQWTRTLDIVENSDYPPSVCGAIAAAAFRNGDFKTAWKLLNRIVDFERKPCDEAFVECIAVVERMSIRHDAEKLLVEMLSFCRNNDVLLSFSCAKKLKEVFKSRFSMRANFTIVKTNVCTSCGTELEQNDLNLRELQCLCDSFKSKVVIGSNIFVHSTPAEVDRFYKFIETRKPFNVVLDGLNIAFNLHHGKSSLTQNALQLRNAILQLRQSNGNRILMVGRKHMQERWPRKIMAEVQKIAEYFFVEDISKDDPFLLYAALVSGPDTYLVSNDVFRNHRFRLEDDGVRRLFDRWRSSRQILFPTRSNGKLTFQQPLKHGIWVQGSFENGWHVPVHEEDGTELGPYDYCKRWLCVDNK